MWSWSNNLLVPIILLDAERYCGSKVSCPRTQHNNPSQGLSPKCLIWSSAYSLLDYQGFHRSPINITFNMCLLWYPAFSSKKVCCLIPRRISVYHMPGCAQHFTRFPKHYLPLTYWYHFIFFSKEVQCLPGVNWQQYPGQLIISWPETPKCGISIIVDLFTWIWDL